MLKNKKFDCVQMKWDIQKRIQKDYEGLSDSDSIKKLERKIQQDRLMAEFYDKIRTKTHSHSETS